MADLQKQSDEQRQAFRAFWLQVAQLILMNLFFPLLTALLGLHLRDPAGAQGRVRRAA